MSGGVEQQSESRIPTPTYEVSQGDLTKDRDKLLHIWKGSLGSSNNLGEKYDWAYSENALGIPLIFLLHHAPSSACVGVTSVAQRNFQTAGQQLRAGLLFDLAVESRHRTLYPALLLQQTTLDIGLRDFVFLYGFPNKSAVPVVARVGYVKLGEVARFVRFLRTRQLLNKYLPNPFHRLVSPAVDWLLLAYYRVKNKCKHRRVAEWLDTPDERFDQLWQRVDTRNCIIGVRDSAFLRWRFSEHPGHTYRFFAMHTANKEKLVGYAVCETRGDTLCVLDFFAENWEQELRCLFQRLFQTAFQQGYTSVSVEFMGQKQVANALCRVGMVARETRPIYFKAHTEKQAQLANGNWYITSSDEDQ